MVFSNLILTTTLGDSNYSYFTNNENLACRDKELSKVAQLGREESEFLNPKLAGLHHARTIPPVLCYLPTTTIRGGSDIMRGKFKRVRKICIKMPLTTNASFSFTTCILLC